MPTPAAPSTTASLSFTPCVEDAQGCSRHPHPLQNVLLNVNRTLLSQVHHGALAHANAVAATEGSDTTSCGESARHHHDPPRQHVWRESYAVLWSKRDAVPEYLRREWLETALTCAEKLDLCWSGPTTASSSPGTTLETAVPFRGDALMFDWLFDAPLFWHPAAVPDAYTAQQQEIIRQGEGSLPDNTGATNSGAQGKKRKAKRKKKWVLWDDASRGGHGIHHLTMPTTVHGALRPADIAKMEGTAFPARVRAWLAAATVSPNANQEHGRVMFPTTAPPICEDPDDIQLFHLLAALRTGLVAGQDGGEALTALPQSLRQLRGAVRFRLVLEIACCRLPSRPRCLPTWRLLAEVLVHLAAFPKDSSASAPDPSPILRALSRYILGFVVPYIEMRDRFASVLQNTFTFDLREEMMQAAGGCGAWGAALSEVLPNSCRAWGTEERVACVRQALLNACAFVDEPPTHGTHAPSLDHSVVLGYRDGPATTDGAREGTAASSHQQLFDSPACRQRCLDDFIARYLLLIPLEAFDRPHSRGAAPDTNGRCRDE